MPQSEYQRKQYFKHPGKIGKIRRRIRSLRIHAYQLRQEGRDTEAYMKTLQADTLRQYVRLIEMEERRHDIIEDIQSIGDVGISDLEDLVGGDLAKLSKGD